MNGKLEKMDRDFEVMVLFSAVNERKKLVHETSFTVLDYSVSFNELLMRCLDACGIRYSKGVVENSPYFGTTVESFLIDHCGKDCLGYLEEDNGKLSFRPFGGSITLCHHRNYCHNYFYQNECLVFHWLFEKLEKGEIDEDGSVSAPCGCKWYPFKSTHIEMCEGCRNNELAGEYASVRLHSSNWIHRDLEKAFGRKDRVDDSIFVKAVRKYGSDKWILLILFSVTIPSAAYYAEHCRYSKISRKALLFKHENYNVHLMQCGCIRIYLTDFAHENLTRCDNCFMNGRIEDYQLRTYFGKIDLARFYANLNGIVREIRKRFGKFIQDDKLKEIDRHVRERFVKHMKNKDAARNLMEGI